MTNFNNIIKIILIWSELFHFFSTFSLPSSFSKPMPNLAIKSCNWLIHTDNLPPQVYANSGKFINDLGDYNNCLFNKDEFTYFTMRFLNKFVGMQYIGLCAPNECK